MGNIWGISESINRKSWTSSKDQRSNLLMVLVSSTSANSFLAAATNEADIGTPANQSWIEYSFRMLSTSLIYSVLSYSILPYLLILSSDPSTVVPVYEIRLMTFVSGTAKIKDQLNKDQRSTDPCRLGDIIPECTDTGGEIVVISFSSIFNPLFSIQKKTRSELGIRVGKKYLRIFFHYHCQNYLPLPACLIF